MISVLADDQRFGSDIAVTLYGQKTHDAVSFMISKERPGQLRQESARPFTPSATDRVIPMVAQTQNAGQDWLDLRRAAEYVGVNERTLRNYIAAGALAASRLGPRQIRIKRDDLDGLMCPISQPAVYPHPGRAVRGP